MDDVAALGSPLDRGALKVGKVLAGKGKDGGLGLRLESNEIGGRSFITVGRTPDIDVGSSAEMGKGLNGLVGRAVFPKTDGIMGSNPDDLVAAQSGETDRSGSVRDEILQ